MSMRRLNLGFHVPYIDCHGHYEKLSRTNTSIHQRWDCPRGTIFHSDRGSQYTAHATQQLLGRLGFQPSFSRLGKPADNAWSESFFANMKKEIIHWNHFRTREEARQTVFTYN